MTEKEVLDLKVGDKLVMVSKGNSWRIKEGAIGEVVEPGVHLVQISFSLHSYRTYVQIQWQGDREGGFPPYGLAKWTDKLDAEYAGISKSAMIKDKFKDQFDPKNEYNTTCKCCGGPALLLLTTMDCPKCGRL